MIAIFAPLLEVQHMFLTPEKNFKVVRNLNDVRGKVFTGVIMYYGWYNEDSLVKAHSALRESQPELF